MGTKIRLNRMGATALVLGAMFVATGCGNSKLASLGSGSLSSLFGTLLDSDGDGIPDIFDADPFNPDVNGNGILDGVDPAVNIGLVQTLAGAGDANTNNDTGLGGLVDNNADDWDRDGIPNDLDEFPYDPDHNKNGIIDGLEQDSDGDGIPDAIDKYPRDPDHNNNGIPDGWENDYDNDGIPDSFDEHPTNPDFNGNGILDGLEHDIDGDGIPDKLDPDPLNGDSNGNGILDGIEEGYLQQNHLLGPGGEAPDEDNDGLPLGIDPDDHNPDFDGDGVPDGADEYPLDPTRQ